MMKKGFDLRTATGTGIGRMKYNTQPSSMDIEPQRQWRRSVGNPPIRDTAQLKEYSEVP